MSTLQDYMIDAESLVDEASMCIRKAADAARSSNDSTLPRRLFDMARRLERLNDELDGQITRTKMGM